jgi:hypothetical protein
MIKFNNNSTLNDEIEKEKAKRYIKKDKKPNSCL